MGIITVRDVDDTLRDRLEERARISGRSVEDEARVILTQAVASDPTPDAPEWNAFWSRTGHIQARLGDRDFSDSTAIIRAMRDERSDSLGRP